MLFKDVFKDIFKNITTTTKTPKTKKLSIAIYMMKSNITIQKGTGTRTFYAREFYAAHKIDIKECLIT